MKISRVFVLLSLFALTATLAVADTIDTRFNVEDPSGTGTFPTVITSNQFVTDSDGGLDLSGTYTGSPIYSLELVIPANEIIGPLSCASNVFLVAVVQPNGGNPGVCHFNSLYSLGLNNIITPDLTGKDDPGGVLNCSLLDLDDCIGIQTGHFVDLGIPENMPSVPNAAIDLAANGAAPLPFAEPGSGISLMMGFAGLFLAARRFRGAKSAISLS
ncbi:MAG TPA: hypothetical protein VG322_12635 [Candidatus Acidoferrales bacterium]|nr:hypothetical protein [Candidatus Acidoferrales bacterium]